MTFTIHDFKKAILDECGETEANLSEPVSALSKSNTSSLVDIPVTHLSGDRIKDILVAKWKNGLSYASTDIFDFILKNNTMIFTDFKWVKSFGKIEPEILDQCKKKASDVLDLVFLCLKNQHFQGTEISKNARIDYQSIPKCFYLVVNYETSSTGSSANLKSSLVGAIARQQHLRDIEEFGANYTRCSIVSSTFWENKRTANGLASK
jgi:hypothetical protein